MTRIIDRPGAGPAAEAGYERGRSHVAFAVCLALYFAFSVGAIRVGVHHVSLQTPIEAQGVATAVGWMTGASVAVLNIALPLGGALLAIVVMGFLCGAAIRPMLLFDAYWIVALAALTPLSAVALDLLAPGLDGSTDGFDVLVGRVQVVSLAALTMTVVYIWGFLRNRFHERSGDAALSTLVGVAASYACITTIRVLGSILDLAS